LREQLRSFLEEQLGDSWEELLREACLEGQLEGIPLVEQMRRGSFGGSSWEKELSSWNSSWEWCS
jgi:hypothetical protein